MEKLGFLLEKKMLSLSSISTPEICCCRETQCFDHGGIHHDTVKLPASPAQPIEMAFGVL